VSWDEKSVLEAGRTLDGAGTLWVLFLANNNEVGKGKTSNLRTLESSVRSYAQRIGLDDPDTKQVYNGFDIIEDRTVYDADGNGNTVNDDNKSNDLVKLTSLGQGLVTKIDNDDRIENKLKDLIEADTDEVSEPWWPYGDPTDDQEDRELFIRTFADRSALDADETEITAIISFDCVKCSERIEDVNFDLQMQDGSLIEWGRTETVECPECSCVNKICPIDQDRPPEVA
jgi:hypothetical protein